MRNSITYCILFVVLGAVIGWLCRGHYSRDGIGITQRDTVVKYERVFYSRLELSKNTYELEIPKIDKKELVFIPEHSTTIIYRDSVRYVTLPRNFYFTKVEDAEIWHSGIDSRIDSVNVFRRSISVTESFTPAQQHRRWGIGIQVGYGLHLHAGELRGAPYVGVGISYNILTF